MLLCPSTSVYLFLPSHAAAMPPTATTAASSGGEGECSYKDPIRT